MQQWHIPFEVYIFAICSLSSIAIYAYPAMKYSTRGFFLISLSGLSFTGIALLVGLFSNNDVAVWLGIILSILTGLCVALLAATYVGMLIGKELEEGQ